MTFVRHYLTILQQDLKALTPFDRGPLQSALSTGIVLLMLPTFVMLYIIFWLIGTEDEMKNGNHPHWTL